MAPFLLFAISWLAGVLNKQMELSQKNEVYYYEIHFNQFKDSTGRSWPPSLNFTEMKELLTFDSTYVMELFHRYQSEIQKKR